MCIRDSTSDEWITTRTGMKKRHVVENGMMTSDLATQAALSALKDSGLKAEELDLIIVATTTPDKTFPATAVKVQHNIGASNAFAHDIQAVCSGFIYALSSAYSHFKAGVVKNALIIGAETLSNLLDWNDRTTCVLFGDGAGAFVLKADESTDRGIIDVNLYSDGNLYDFLKTTGGVSENKSTGTISMEGKEIFRHAVEKMSNSVKNIIEKNG